MKICHITSAHSRYDVRIFEKECKSLSRAGYETYLLVNDDAQDELNSNVNIISTGLKCSSRKDRFIYGRKLILEKALLLNADLYHLHDPDLLGVGFKLKKIGKIVIFDSHEDVPSQILEKSWIPQFMRKSISKLYEHYEKYIIKYLDAVITVTPHITSRIKKIANDTVEITNYPLKSDILTSDNKPGKLICFTGGIEEQWNHCNVIEAISVNDLNITYVLAGTSTEEYINKLKNIGTTDIVEYKGKVSHIEAQNIQRDSIVGIALLRYNSNAGGKLGTLGNTKLFEYMKNGLPVICTNFLLWADIINTYDCGICVEPDNIEQIGKAIKYFVNNPYRAIEMGKNGQKAILEKYNWETQEQKLLKLYKTLLQ